MYSARLGFDSKEKDEVDLIEKMIFKNKEFIEKEESSKDYLLNELLMTSDRLKRCIDDISHAKSAIKKLEKDLEIARISLIKSEKSDG